MLITLPMTWLEGSLSPLSFFPSLYPSPKTSKHWLPPLPVLDTAPQSSPIVVPAFSASTEGHIGGGGGDEEEAGRVSQSFSHPLA